MFPAGSGHRGRGGLKVGLGVGVVVLCGVLVRQCVTSGFQLGEVQEASGDPDAYVDRSVGFEIVLPDGWVSASLVGDRRDLGTDMYPSDPELASFAQEVFGELPSGFVLAAADERFGERDTIVLQIGVDSARGGKGSYEGLVRGTEEAIEINGWTKAGDDIVPFLGGDGVRIEFDVPSDPPGSGLVYAGVAGDRAWRIVVIGGEDEIDAQTDELDTIAASLRALE